MNDLYIDIALLKAIGSVCKYEYQNPKHSTSLLLDIIVILEFRLTAESRSNAGTSEIFRGMQLFQNRQEVMKALHREELPRERKLLAACRPIHTSITLRHA